MRLPRRFSRGITVIPVLVGGARMPPAEHLPPALAALRYRNAFEVRDERFDDDVARLSDAIKALGVGDDAGSSGTGRDSPARSPGCAHRGGRPRRCRCRRWRLLAVAAGRDSTRRSRAQRPLPWSLHLRSTATGSRRYRKKVSRRSGFGSPLWSPATVLQAWRVIHRRRADPRRTPGRARADLPHVTRPQFESTPAIIRYQAEVGDEEIRFTITDDYGIAKGVARRRPPSP